MLRPIPSSHPHPNLVAQGRTCAGDCTSCGGTSPCPLSPSSPGGVSQLQERLPSYRKPKRNFLSMDVGFGSGPGKRKGLRSVPLDSWLLVSKVGKAGAMKTEMVKLEMETM